MHVSRILVVEDETIVAMDIAQGLRRLGYEITGVVGNGRAALDLAVAAPPDIVLMDVNLREISTGSRPRSSCRRDGQRRCCFSQRTPTLPPWSARNR